MNAIKFRAHHFKPSIKAISVMPEYPQDLEEDS